MAPAGGGKVQPPTQAQQIVQKMVEGDKQKKLDSAEQSQNLKDQARTQESLRDKGRAGKKEGEGRGEKARGREGDPAAKARSRATPRDIRSKGEKQMDGFLSRQSSQSQQRSAGKTFTRGRNQTTMNPQGWSVANSAQTSPKAQRAILARQAGKGNLGQTAGRPAQGRSAPLPGQTRTAGQQALRTPSPRQAPLRGPQIRYAQPRQPSSQRTARPLTHRNLARQNLSRQLGKLAVTAQNQSAAQTGKAKPTVVVHIRGTLIFVKDGPKTRAFKLQKDGNLSELPTDDASEQPLSPEAKAHLQKVLRQKGVRTGAEGKTAHESGEITEEQLAQLISEQQAAEGEGTESLDLETRFALLLYEVLDEEKKIGKKLGEGEDPQFPSKKDWEAFFAKMMKVGNQEKNAKKTMSDILSMLFRGIFNKKGKGRYLVGDLKYFKSGKNREEKFAQIQINNDGMLKLLKSLKPGQSIDKNVLQEFFGEELDFLKMAHLGEKTFNMATGAEKNVTFNPKANIDPYSQARLENSIFNSRRDGTSARRDSASLSPDSFPGPEPQGVFANVYELLGLRKKFEGNPKLYTAVGYLLITAAVGLGVTFFVLSQI